jgi:hypothetical protein
LNKNREKIKNMQEVETHQDNETAHGTSDTTSLA